MSWLYVTVGSAIAGGISGAQGAMNSGKAAYTAGQKESHQEKERNHYETKILQRQMLEQLHMNFAKGAASGIQINEGSPMEMAMHTINNLKEDKAQMARTSAKDAQKLWQAGADQFSAAQYKATGSLLSGLSSAAGTMSE